MPYKISPTQDDKEYHVFQGRGVTAVNPLIHFEKKITDVYHHLRLLEGTNGFHNISQKFQTCQGQRL